jgi:hypothetical protein
MVQKPDPCVYIIASIAGDQSTLLHEWAHATYFIDKSFKDVCDEMYDGLEPTIRIAIEKELAMRKYSPSVYKDEFQAYVLEDCADFGKRWSNILRPHHLKLRQLVDRPKLDRVFSL